MKDHGGDIRKGTEDKNSEKQNRIEGDDSSKLNRIEGENNNKPNWIEGDNGDEKSGIEDERGGGKNGTERRRQEDDIAILTRRLFDLLDRNQALAEDVAEAANQRMRAAEDNINNLLHLVQEALAALRNEGGNQ